LAGKECENSKTNRPQWNVGGELILKIDCENAQIEIAGEGAMKSKKTTHNSVVEASPYMNECFVPEIRDEFCALSNKREKNSRHN